MERPAEQYLVIRTDANTQIGMGHFMRCLALAQNWQDKGGRSIFVMSEPGFEDRMKSEGMEVAFITSVAGTPQDAFETNEIASRVCSPWIVVDGYNFDAQYQKSIKDEDLNLLFIDDMGHCDHYYADIVLNQNLHADEDLYVGRESYTQLLLGTRYVLLRREFLKWCGWKREIPKTASKVLVTMGGSDPNDVTLKVIQAIGQVATSNLKVAVVIGGNNPHEQELESTAGKSKVKISLYRQVIDMSELMAWADIAISGGGTTCWEMTFMGLSSLIFVLADNQLLIAEKLNKAKIAENLGWPESCSLTEISQALSSLLRDSERRTEMTRRGRELVDGFGAKRVLAHLERKTLRLRRAQESDCRLLWQWANDPEVRAVAFSSAPIPWESHLEWFQSKLYSSQGIIYIATNSKGASIGQIRYDIEGNQAEASIIIDRDFRGKGYGASVIELASHKLFDETEVTVINSYVKPSNEASASAFMKAGFSKAGKAVIRGHEANHLILRREKKTEEYNKN